MAPDVDPDDPGLIALWLTIVALMLGADVHRAKTLALGARRSGRFG